MILGAPGRGSLWSILHEKILAEKWKIIRRRWNEIGIQLLKSWERRLRQNLLKKIRRRRWWERMDFVHALESYCFLLSHVMCFHSTLTFFVSLLVAFLTSFLLLLFLFSLLWLHAWTDRHDDDHCVTLNWARIRRRLVSWFSGFFWCYY